MPDQTSNYEHEVDDATAMMLLDVLEEPIVLQRRGERSRSWSNWADAPLSRDGHHHGGSGEPWHWP